MPRLDKTGPSGQGPLTGRGFGECNQEGAKSFSYGRGRGRGMGRGMSRNNGRFGVSNNTSNLENEKRYLENRLQEINQELDK
jgi:hypothetical protein